MKYRHVGKSGLQVSELSLGSWLTYGDTVDANTAEEIIDIAYENGINSFDTANCYHNGQAEIVLGNALKKHPRNSLVIASKIFTPMGEGPNDRGLSRKHLTEQMNAILSRLQTDYVDILYCHRFDVETPLYETLRTLDDFIRSGKALYLGVSEWTASQIAQAITLEDRYLLDRIVVSQPLYNLLVRRVETEVLPLCNHYGIGQMAFSPIAMGMLTGKYQRNQEPPKGSRAASESIGQWIRGDYFCERNFRKVERLRSVAEQAGESMTNLSLAWLLSKQGVASAIIGSSRKEQVCSNLRATELVLSQDLVAAIEQAVGDE